MKFYDSKKNFTSQCRQANNLPLSKLIPDIIELVVKSNIYPFKEVNSFFNAELICIAIKKFSTLILKDVIFYFKINDIIKMMYSNLHTYRQNSIIDKMTDYLTIDCDEFGEENQILLKFEMWNALSESMRIRIEEGDPIYDSDLVDTAVKFLKWPMRNIKLVENVSLN